MLESQGQNYSLYYESEPLGASTYQAICKLEYFSIGSICN
jgi:hypothetical protein